MPGTLSMSTFLTPDTKGQVLPNLPDPSNAAVFKPDLDAVGVKG